MACEDNFSATYGEARHRFLDACRRAGARVTSHGHPATGPGGEALATDAAWLGPADAALALVVISGTHGVEGFCGSGVQCGLLLNGDAPELPPATGLLLVHAINPHGFAWLSRVTEDNVDLNRNFVAHGGDYPDNPGYRTLADALVPAHWDAHSLAAAQAELDAYGSAHGLFGLQAATSGGQYSHPDGVFFGGHAPTWSRRTLERIVAENLPSVRAAAAIDLHTGLGPYGYGEPICPMSDAAALARARAWYGAEVTSPDEGDSASAPVTGHLGLGLIAAAPSAQWTVIALEFGTLALDDVFLALRADAWLRRHGDPESAQGRAIKRQLRDAFYPDEPEWKRKVWARAAEMVAKAYRGLAED